MEFLIEQQRNTAIGQWMDTAGASALAGGALCGIGKKEVSHHGSKGKSSTVRMREDESFPDALCIGARGRTGGGL